MANIRQTFSRKAATTTQLASRPLANGLQVGHTQTEGHVTEKPLEKKATGRTLDNLLEMERELIRRYRAHAKNSPMMGLTSKEKIIAQLTKAKGS